MFEEDHAPVTLSENYHQAASCQRTIQLAQARSRVFNRFQPNLVNEIARIGPRVLAVAPKSIEFSDSRVTSLDVCSNGNPLRGDNLLPAFYAHVGHLLAYWRAATRDLDADASRHCPRGVVDRLI